MSRSRLISTKRIFSRESKSVFYSIVLKIFDERLFEFLRRRTSRSQSYFHASEKII